MHALIALVSAMCFLSEWVASNDDLLVFITSYLCSFIWRLPLTMGSALKITARSLNTCRNIPTVLALNDFALHVAKTVSVHEIVCERLRKWAVLLGVKFLQYCHAGTRTKHSPSWLWGMRMKSYLTHLGIMNLSAYTFVHLVFPYAPDITQPM
jgi:hypothetical protein